MKDYEVINVENNKYKKQAEQIMQIAEENGVQGNFLFTTTFDRYLFLLDNLEQLKNAIQKEGMTVEKEYIKGEKNAYSSPSVRSYNSTCDLANKTVATLMKIIKSFNVEENTDEDNEDPLLKAINGSDANEE